MAFDPFDPVVLADPYPAYAEIRETEGLTHLPLLDAWLVSRHEDVVAVLRQARLYSSARGMGDLVAMAFAPDEQRAAPRLLILEDPPVHTALRRMVARGFTPSRIAVAEPTIADIARRNVADLVERGSDGELMRDLAMPFPVRVIAELLGIPPERFEEFRSWSDVIVKAFSITPDPAGAEVAIAAINGFFAEVVDERRTDPGDDLVSLLVRAGGEGEDPLSLDELVNFCILLLIAGNETTTNLLGNALLVLLDRPDLEARLRADRTLIAPFVEEVLRFDSPVQSLFRGLSAPATLAGVDLPEGARLMVLLGGGQPRRAPGTKRPTRCASTASPAPRRTTWRSGPASICASVPRWPVLEARVALDALLDATSALRIRRHATRTASSCSAAAPRCRWRDRCRRSPRTDRSTPASAAHCGRGLGFRLQRRPPGTAPAPALTPPRRTATPAPNHIAGCRHWTTHREHGDHRRALPRAGARRRGATDAVVPRGGEVGGEAGHHRADVGAVAGAGRLPIRRRRCAGRTAANGVVNAEATP